MAAPPTESPHADEQHRPGGWGLWLGLTVPITHWWVHLAGMAALAPYVCHSGNVWAYHLLSVLTLVPSAAAAVPCWRAWKAGEGEGGVPFLGIVGVLSAAIFSAAIVAEWVPVFLLDRCAS